jgi:hypothetical protein
MLGYLPARNPNPQTTHVPFAEIVKVASSKAALYRKLVYRGKPRT